MANPEEGYYPTKWLCCSERRVRNDQPHSLLAKVNESVETNMPMEPVKSIAWMELPITSRKSVTSETRLFSDQLFQPSDGNKGL